MAKISLITVTYNAERYLEDCIASVAAQKDVDLEYIIVDALSSDGTMEIVRNKRDVVSAFVSESDEGMYDAINKGINLATGDVIGLLHADDFLASEATLSKVEALFSLHQVDVLYGDLDYVSQSDPSKVLRRWRSQSYKQGLFQFGWMPAHPTFYCKREFFARYGDYRLDMGTAADYELMMRFLHKHRAKSFYLPEVMVKMRAGGMSNSSLANRLKANQADLRALNINGIKYPRLAAVLKPLRKIPQFIGL